MGFQDDLKSDVVQIFDAKWSRRNGQVVPESKDVGLGNDGVDLDATVLYADISESTKLVDDYKDWFAAKIYKTYLHCAAKIIRREGGAITAYDGDRIMAVFIGNSKNSTAARTGLKINYAATKIISPALAEKYPKTSYKLTHAVGIDTSKILVARTGIRGSNDLVWVGKAANHAAKLTSGPGNPTRISKAVYSSLNEKSKLSDGKDMWTVQISTDVPGNLYYGSTFIWTC